jgi:hypothetical protein
VKIHPQWVVTPGKQTNKQTDCEEEEESHNRPDMAQRVPGDLGSQIS